MKILGIFYTHNQINNNLLNEVVKRLQIAQYYSNKKAENEVTLAVSSWEIIPGWAVGNEYISTDRTKGHANICKQILRVMYDNENKFDAIAFLEHDVLYAPKYFDQMAAPLNLGLTKIVVNLNYIGMNKNGYVRQKLNQVCLSQIVQDYKSATQNIERALKDCERQGWAFLEPTLKDDFYFLPATTLEDANVHINMNATGESHHLTNHYDTYEAEPYIQIHPLWGDSNSYSFF